MNQPRAPSPSALPRRARPRPANYTATRDWRAGGLATLPVARKLACGCYHTLRELGEEALQPAA